MRQPREVLDELRRRARRGKSLGSGANRGDWLYAAACHHFGSWGAAVEAAGFDYDDIKTRPMKSEEVLDNIRDLVTSGDRLFAIDHSKLARAAVRHFGTWKDALAAAGHGDANLKWSKERVIAGIRQRQKNGKPVNSVQMMKHDRNLYMAGRRRFGDWATALDVALDGEAPVVQVGRPGRPKKKSRTQ